MTVPSPASGQSRPFGVASGAPSVSPSPTSGSASARRHQPQARATCPGRARNRLEACRPGLVRVRGAPDHRGDFGWRQPCVDHCLSHGSSVRVGRQHDLAIRRQMHDGLGRASDPCQPPSAILRNAEEARRRSARCRRGEEPEAEARIDISEEARGKVRAVGDDRTGDPSGAVGAAPQLAPADRAGRAPRLAPGGPQRRTHQCLDGCRRKAQRKGVAPARRLGVEPGLGGFRRQVRRKPRAGLRESRRQVCEQPGRVLVLERLRQARHPPARRPLGDARTQGALRLDLRENGEDGVTVSRRLGQVGVGQPAFRHERIEQKSIAIVRASDRSAPPLEAFDGQLSAHAAVRGPTDPAKQPLPCQTAGRQLGADFLRGPKNETAGRDGMLRVQFETKAKVRSKPRPFRIGACIGEQRSSVRHISCRSMQEVDLDGHASTNRPAIRPQRWNSRVTPALKADIGMQQTQYSSRPT